MKIFRTVTMSKHTLSILSLSLLLFSGGSLAKPRDWVACDYGLTAQAAYSAKMQLA